MTTYARILPLLLAGFTIAATPSFARDRLWTDVKDPAAGNGGPEISAAFYRTLELKGDQLVQLLGAAPPERAGVRNGILITLPMPDGTFEEFSVVASPIMAPGLAARFPAITTYLAQGITDSRASGRLDMTPAGFHAMIFTTDGTVYIDPYSRQLSGSYISYFARDVLPSEERRFEEKGPFGYESDAAREVRAIVEQGLPASVTTGEELRTYRLAVAATGEYTAFHGGTVPAGLAAIVTAMNRVNGIYEREVSIRMVLVENNDLIVYTDPNTDPYTNNNGGTMLGQNQSNLDNVIGTANYDMGHVFSTGGGGVAFLAVPCRAGQKAQGVTGLTQPIGDPFYVDYVAHEMGHQWGANHTFNGTGGSCAGNRAGSAAYEPGSASTIMGYAGICGGDNIQDHSDDYFHLKSLEEIIAYSQMGSGNTCAVITSTGNTPPTVDAGSVVYTVPLQTPFFLTGSGSDIDGDSLTFCWEEYDLGPAGSPNSPTGNAPIFRSFNPTVQTERMFPALDDVLGGTQTIGEIMAGYARTLNFRLTGRDNRAGSGGTGTDATSVVITDAAGPFAVTYPNEDIEWLMGSTDSVVWDVAGTDLSPVNCSQVNILLSTDGGVTFGTTLAANTPNDGHEPVSVPALLVPDTRIKVESVGNIFFDIGNGVIRISDLTSALLAAPADSSEDLPTSPDLFWHTVTAATKYHVMVSIHSGFAFGNALNDSAATDTTAMAAGLETNRRYYWRVRAGNANGWGFWSDVWTFTTSPVTSVTETDPVPDTYELTQNYPNPFNPSTAIGFGLPAAGRARLTVYDLLGRQVAVLADEQLSSGRYSRTWDASGVPSGIYYYRIQAGPYTETRKMLLLK